MRRHFRSFFIFSARCQPLLQVRKCVPPVEVLSDIFLDQWFPPVRAVQFRTKKVGAALQFFTRALALLIQDAFRTVVQNSRGYHYCLVVAHG